MKSMLPIVTVMAASAFAAPTVASAQVAQSAPKVQAAGPGNSSGVTIIGSYYEDRASVNCSNFTNCFLTFSAVPAKKKLIVTTVSCAFKTGNRAIQLFFYEANGPVGGKYRQLNVPVSDYVYATDFFSLAGRSIIRP